MEIPQIHFRTVGGKTHTVLAHVRREIPHQITHYNRYSAVHSKTPDKFYSDVAHFTFHCVPIFRARWPQHHAKTCSNPNTRIYFTRRPSILFPLLFFYRRLALPSIFEYIEWTQSICSITLKENPQEIRHKK